jgi:crotonobetainyl-CoA:carnitine CoA-transferase CaiB-like acyl-CoA transferase
MPWASIGATLLTVTGISAGLYVRERTGRGQHFETSLVQAAIMANAMGWQRPARMHPSYRLWYFDRRAPKGIFRTADGLWLHQFAPIDHDYIRANAAGADPAAGSALVSGRPQVGSAGDYEESVRFQALAHPESARAMATRTRDEWIKIFWAGGRAAQPILSPEEALLDEPLQHEGVIVELEDPEHGPIRQVGHTYACDAVDNPPIRPRRLESVSTSEVLESWLARPDSDRATVPLPAAPLEGIVVLDFGLAIAGPYGTQVLADLGATVIKVTALDFDLTDAIYVGSSHGKLALALDLKHPRGLEVAHRLIATADVVHHNMRTGVAERLQIGYEQARSINPRIVYCHTRGFERDGPRTALPGNDQMGQALSGTEYEAGGTHHGTAPIWGMLGFGDTGNGIVSANAVVQALRHRERTGEGQFVHTSILNVSLLFNSYTYARADGSGPDRRRIDAGEYGFSALQRLYETADGWISVFARDERECAALAAVTVGDELLRDRRFATAAARAAHDGELAAWLGEAFRTRPATEWFAALDAAGVPCEIASSTFARELFDDPEMYRRGWVIANNHEHLGRVEQVGMPFSFSATSAMNLAGAPVTGQHSRSILAALRYSTEEIDELVAAGVVGDGAPAAVG